VLVQWLVKQKQCQVFIQDKHCFYHLIDLLNSKSHHLIPNAAPTATIKLQTLLYQRILFDNSLLSNTNFA
tara:strand:+ start:309 stop:518 length:210 start_codon:yes stop_codon:yes gene_type:complete